MFLRCSCAHRSRFPPEQNTHQVRPSYFIKAFREESNEHNTFNMVESSREERPSSETLIPLPDVKESLEFVSILKEV